MHTIHTERRRDRRALAEQAGVGSISWVSVLAGTLAAYGFTAALLAIVGGIAAAINNGSDFSSVAAGDLKLSAGIIVAVTLFFAFLFGGYVAGRMALRSGVANGLGVFVLSVILAVGIGVWVRDAGGGSSLTSTLRNVGAPTTWHAWRAVGTIAGAISLVAMLFGSMIGGADGERWHAKLVRRALDPTVGANADAPAPSVAEVAPAGEREGETTVAGESGAEAVDRGARRGLRRAPLLASPVASLTEDCQYPVVEQAVGADGAAPVGAGSTGKVAEAPAGLLDDDLEGGQVPERHFRIETDLAGPLGHEQMGPEVAEGPAPPALPGQIQEVGRAAVHRPAVQTRVGKVGVAEAAYP